MLLVRNTPDLSHNALKPSVAAIGFFDGVHLGHYYLIEQVKTEAAKRGFSSSLVTFPVHPRKVMDAEYKPELLTSYDEKVELLETTEIDYCFALDFTSDISHLTAYDFMRSILKERYNVQGLVIGYDHRFGHNRSEGFDDYFRYGKELGIDVIRACARIINKVTISSSVIRRQLHAGDVALAATYLGYEYFLDGTVIDGYKVGRTIGFPTANIHVTDSDKLVPADGVYAVKVTVNNNVYAGMLNIGHRPTINNGGHRSIEVHILHFHSDIYNYPIRISFVQRIRSEMKFTGKEQLVEQLSKDASVVEGLLL
ncbi:bifunctional riboflavin kinase/FAD synthetase [Bacteroides sp. 51]|uniref:bifunctional riboflavin kinase/FAD synthetase n=1 Tax=Bacteroides sp. 51 TaxID=2302938 RepID=UPI0013D3F429|nr:bifunctional riboflavin kinase/FAD synthetase [Bacteroides sp. 51]NDV82200.1 bifunctional riboflavin kinase/FAD synthetase [Bacteroides sp. 51]